MAEFDFLQNPLTHKWVILAPRRAKRPDASKGTAPVCPFCPKTENDEIETYRVGGENGDGNWMVRVVLNKFPFAKIHEVIIHAKEHDKNFESLPQSHVELIFQTYRQRYNALKDKGHVYIFHNRGKKSGESLVHAHTQLVVVPAQVTMDLPSLDPAVSVGYSPQPLGVEGEKLGTQQPEMFETTHFYLFCPQTSQWPDEVWIAPKRRGEVFGEVKDLEISDLAFTITRLIQIMTLRHGSEFSFNFYIYPLKDWYIRLIPRIKSLGGFEIGTGIFVNTQDPKETLQFIKSHFKTPNPEIIKSEHQADYHTDV